MTEYQVQQLIEIMERIALALETQSRQNREQLPFRPNKDPLLDFIKDTDK